MRHYDMVADLPLEVGSVTLDRRERDTSSDFTRVTTTVELSGGGEVGRGEDVCYEADDHDPYPRPAITGEYTFDSFSTALDRADLWPGDDPSQHHAPAMRRWAFESAALDLALKQHGMTLADAVDRERDPVRFVVSTRLDGFDRLQSILDVNPDAEFKLDPTPDWSDDLVDRLAATGRVRILDLKGLYEGTDVDTEPDPAFYELIFEAFPDAVVEDAAVTEETMDLLDDEAGRLAWDYPISGVPSVQGLPWDPRWLNIKPSRFGTVEALFDTIDFVSKRDIELYGGGQFELGVGRDQIQALAALFYPDGPNDVAPSGYNDPELSASLPASPLEPPVGFGRR